MITGCHRQSPGRPSSSKTTVEILDCDLRTRRRPVKLTCLDINDPSVVNELGTTRGAQREHTPLSVAIRMGHPARSSWRVLSAYSGGVRITSANVSLSLASSQVLFMSVRSFWLRFLSLFQDAQGTCCGRPGVAKSFYRLFWSNYALVRHGQNMGGVQIVSEGLSPSPHRSMGSLDLGT